ncbi:hypothetical protein [Cellvibrio sp. UBA7671]|uniref:hypothetical protein n=1 Tax=Cellvibrio sp. UBA7671 TaxID=1946312 RepID=UPI002F356094
MKWWEKTIEYLFIINGVKNRKLNLSPLDGNHELAGDLIAAHDAKFFLIEFKSQYSAIISEHEKFYRFELAKRSLENRDGHHFVVYGELSESNPCTLKLNAQTYFSQIEKPIDDIFISGIDGSNFKAYLQEYIDFKIPPISGSGGGRSLNFGMVAAVDTKTGSASTMSLDEFMINLSLTKNHTKTFSMGM